jgi:hypothetical protein
MLAERDLDISVLKEVDAKKWCTRRRGASRSGSLANAAYPSDVPAGCLASRVPPSAMRYAYLLRQSGAPGT